MGGVYYLLQDSVGFDNLMHGKSPKKNQKQRSLEDFGKSLRKSRILPLVSYPPQLTCFIVVSLQRVSTQHEKSS
jgi:H+-transporting ATPase